MRALGILAFCGMICLGPETMDAQAADDVYSVHLVATEFAPDVRMCEYRNSGEEIALEPAPVLDLQDVEGVSLNEISEDLAEVVVHLSTDGQARLYQVTSENVGRRLAMVVDDEIFAMPRINRATDASELPVGVFQNEFAHQVLAILQASIGQ